MDYLDLYLIHWPCHWKKGTFGCPDYNINIINTWKSMEKLVKIGLVKNIGVSNFGKELLNYLILNCKIKPCCNQIEIHPKLQQEDLVKFCQCNEIMVTAWSPLAKGGLDEVFNETINSNNKINNNNNSNNNEIIISAAKKRNLSVSEFVLLWHLSRNIIAIPRSSNLLHMNDNLNVLKRSQSPQGKHVKVSHVKEEKVYNKLDLLTSEELNAFSSLDRATRLTFDFVGVFEETPRFPWSWIGKSLYFIASVIWMFLPNRLDFKMPS